MEGRPQVPVFARIAQRHLCQILERAAGAVSTLVDTVVKGRAARGQPSGPVPVGDDLVQPCCREPRSARRQAPSNRWKKELGKPLSLQTSFQGNAQHSGTRCRARRSSSPPRSSSSTSSSVYFREPDPPNHHHLDPAICRSRCAVAADGGSLRSQRDRDRRHSSCSSAS